MNVNIKILRAILEQPKVGANDILYALTLIKKPIGEIAAACGVSPTFVYNVIAGDRRSFDVATYIADKLNTTTTRLWGDAYNYTPRKPAAERRVANG